MIFEKHLVPKFGKVPLGRITQRSVQMFVDGLGADGLARTRCGSITSYSTSASRRGRREHAGSQSRAGSRFVLPAVRSEERRYLTPDEVAKLATAIDPRYRALIMLAAYSGLRIGELAGLRQNCLDLVDGWVEVREIAVEVRGQVYFGPPKARRSIRRVRRCGAGCNGVTGAFARLSTGGRLVFCGARGSVLRPTIWRARIWSQAVAVAGLAPLTPCAAAFTAVSIWITANVSPAEIAVRAGHASSVVVLDRYGHLFPHGDDDFRDRVSAMYVGPSRTTPPKQGRSHCDSRGGSGFSAG